MLDKLLGGLGFAVILVSMILLIIFFTSTKEILEIAAVQPDSLCSNVEYPYIKGSIAFHESNNDRLQYMDIAEDSTIQGIPCAANVRERKFNYPGMDTPIRDVYFHDTGMLKQCVLSMPIHIKGLNLPKHAMVEFTKDGIFNGYRVADSRILFGQTLPKSTFVKYTASVLFESFITPVEFSIHDIVFPPQTKIILHGTGTLKEAQAPDGQLFTYQNIPYTQLAFFKNDTIQSFTSIQPNELTQVEFIQGGIPPNTKASFDAYDHLIQAQCLDEDASFTHSLGWKLSSIELDSSYNLAQLTTADTVQIPIEKNGYTIPYTDIMVYNADPGTYSSLQLPPKTTVLVNSYGEFKSIQTTGDASVEYKGNKYSQVTFYTGGVIKDCILAADQTIQSFSFPANSQLTLDYAGNILSAQLPENASIVYTAKITSLPVNQIQFETGQKLKTCTLADQLEYKDFSFTKGTTIQFDDKLNPIQIDAAGDPFTYKDIQLSKLYFNAAGEIKEFIMAQEYDFTTSNSLVSIPFLQNVPTDTHITLHDNGALATCTSGTDIPILYKTQNYKSITVAPDDTITEFTAAEPLVHKGVVFPPHASVTLEAGKTFQCIQCPKNSFFRMGEFAFSEYSRYNSKTIKSFQIHEPITIEKPLNCTIPAPATILFYPNGAIQSITLNQQDMNLPYKTFACSQLFFTQSGVVKLCVLAVDGTLKNESLPAGSILKMDAKGDVIAHIKPGQ